MKKKQQGILTELWHTRTVRIWTFCAGALLLIAIVMIIFIVQPARKDEGVVPEAVVKIANFTPYFYKEIPAAFTASRANVSYTSNVLVVRLTSTQNQSVVMTQQALPGDLAQTSIQGETIEGAPGTGVISASGGHTTATLFTSDQKTMIVITTSDTVDREALKQLLRELRPLR